MNYNEFIQSIKESRENKWFEYSERHHIFPKCLGGTDDEDNLIYLTYEEHFTAHKLLYDEHPDNKDLLYAVMVMSRNGELEKEDYAYLKKAFSDSQRGNKHYEGKSHTEEWRNSCSDWMKGRKQCLGKVHIHRGNENRMVDSAEMDYYLKEGYELGRGKFHSEETKEVCRAYAIGRIWINNGNISKMVYESDGIPEGWSRGRLMKKDNKGRFVKSNG